MRACCRTHAPFAQDVESAAPPLRSSPPPPCVSLTDSLGLPLMMRHRMKTTSFNEAFSPSADVAWKAKKFNFDQTANLAHIPVVKATRKPFGMGF